MVAITKVSSKGQIVIPSEIRERMNLDEGSILLVSESGDSIQMKKIELPKVKSWKEAAKPFRDAVKKSSFTEQDLEKLIAESRVLR